LLLVSCLIGCFAISPNAQAVSPPPDGGYAGGNTAEGRDALLSLTTGTYNTATGFLSLKSNTTGKFNTAIGAGALLVNTADQNTATGAGALLSNTTGSNNTALGRTALTNNTTGTDNTALGLDALFNNTTANANTGIGRTALGRNTTGEFNTALGFGAGQNLTTGDNNIDIDNFGVAGESGVIRIGESEFQAQTFIAGISGTAVTGTAVVVNGSGQLGVAPSSERFKQKIKSMDKTSESILALRPVTFHYQKEIETQRRSTVRPCR
jgi:Chaperone of endosialidase